MSCLTVEIGGVRRWLWTLLAFVGGVAYGNGAADFPEGTDPRTVGLRLAQHFASCAPDAFAPRGYSGASMSGAFISYPISVLWANSIEVARRLGDRELETRLASTFAAPFLPGGAKNGKCPDPCHVDLSVFGTVMLESYLSTKDRCALAFGETYVERQWAEPTADDYARLPASMRGGGHTRELAERTANWRAGLTGQTRFWTDDLFMIGYLQTRGALAATADGRPDVARVRLERAARQAVRYLDDLQLKSGRAEGLFYHAPNAPQVWGRGNGWAAAGLTVILDNLPQDSTLRPRLLAGYRKMMAALLKWRRPNGFWGQLVDVPRSWDESSATAIFTYAFIRGVKNGWLDAATYGPAARQSYLALVAKLDADANLADVCVGTDIGATEDHYLGRDKVTGAPHGQAGLLLCVNAWLAPSTVERRLIWSASAYGEADEAAYSAGTWKTNAELLKAAGFTDVIVAVGRGNMAHYPSQRLARTTAAKKGVFADCLAACHARGLKVHAWRVCYRMHDDPGSPEVKALWDKLHDEGRLVKTFNATKGIEQEWMCPTDPRNQAFEIEAIVDMARYSGADGVHLDYIRHRSGDCCCDGCRTRFETLIGRTLSDWPAVLKTDKTLAGQWKAFREESITKVVRTASQLIRREFPAMEISAAVQKENETYAQDWPTWIKKGFCNFVCPMDYTPLAERFRKYVRPQVQTVCGTNGKVYPGIGFSAGSGRWPDDGKDMERLADQLKVLREEGATGFCLFDLTFGDGKTKRALPEIRRVLTAGE